MGVLQRIRARQRKQCREQNNQMTSFKQLACLPAKKSFCGFNSENYIRHNVEQQDRLHCRVSEQWDALRSLWSEHDAKFRAIFVGDHSESVASSAYKETTDNSLQNQSESGTAPCANLQCVKSQKEVQSLTRQLADANDRILILENQLSLLQNNQTKSPEQESNSNISYQQTARDQQKTEQLSPKNFGTAEQKNDAPKKKKKSRKRSKGTASFKKTNEEGEWTIEEFAPLFKPNNNSSDLPINPYQFRVAGPKYDMIRSYFD